MRVEEMSVKADQAALGFPGNQSEGHERPEFSTPLWLSPDVVGEPSAEPDAAAVTPPAPTEPPVDLLKPRTVYPPPEAAHPFGSALGPPVGDPVPDPLVDPVADPFGDPSPDPRPDPRTGVEDALGWDFGPTDDGAITWGDEAPRRPLWMLIVGVGLILTVLVVAAVILFMPEDKKPEPPPPAPAPVPATPIAPELLAQYQPVRVLALPFDGRLQVTWQPPAVTDRVYGYMVAAQNPAGELIQHILVRGEERIAVFNGASAVPGTCVVVTTLVSGEPSMMLAKSDAVCPGAGSPSPGASGSPSAPASPGAANGTTPPASGTAIDPDDQMIEE